MSLDRDAKAALPADCRAFRADPDARSDAPHARACAACAGLAAHRRRLADAIARPPAPPAALAARDVLAGIHARIVEGIESASAVAPRLADPVAPPAELAARDDLPGHDRLADGLARALANAPKPPSEAQWQVVRRAVIFDIGARRANRARVTIWLGLAGAAAAALFVLLNPAAGPSKAPQIVFADLDAMPAVDFAVVRRGANR